MKQKRVAILGAGPSGLAQLRAFQTLRDQGGAIPEIICYEKQDDWGGMWRYNWETGTDKYGEPIHGSMYRFLWINAPKEALEFGDYTFDEHFGQPMPSYLPRAVLRDYIVSRVERSDIRQYIRFNSAVRWVEYDEASEQFSVTVHDHLNDQLVTECFDYVVVATGHFSTPNYPEVTGLNRFVGRVLHSHQYRDAQEFKDQHILIVGSSYSAEDIGSQCFKYGAKAITYSYRSKPMGFNWPATFDEYPSLMAVEGSRAYFVDGRSVEVDAIIFCTGYQFRFPFLASGLRLKTENCLYPAGLYKGIVWIKQPQLIYLGMQDQYFTFNMFDTQAWYARDLIMEKIPLPDEEGMRQDSEKWMKKLAELGGAEALIDYQASYITDLINETDYPDFNVDQQAAILKSWLKDKRVDMIGFRNQSYASTLTKTMASGLPKPWIEMLDDSSESFMQQLRPLKR